MKIGIIGTGNMGRSLGTVWARSGHDVLFGSRDPQKAARVARDTGANSAVAGTFDEAAAFGEAVLYTLRDPLLPSSVLKDCKSLVGKVVIDCNNSVIWGMTDPDPLKRPGIHFPWPIPSLAERLAVDIPGALVVKAFNTIPHAVIELGRERLKERDISVFLCSDHVGATERASQLVEDAGFTAVDCGGLERSQLVESVADFIRWQIVGMNRGPYTAISLGSIPLA